MYLFLVYYTLAPPPCSALIIMTATIMIVVTNVMTLFILRFDMKDYYTVNILQPILKTKNFLKKLNNRRLSQFNILFIHSSRYFISDIIAYQLANSRGEIKINRFNIFCHKTVLQGPVNSLTNQFSFFL